MKALRLFTVVLLAVLVISSWAPAPAYAKPSGDANPTVELAKTKLARLRVTNKTGGTLFVAFSGERSYSFSTSSQGKTTFDAVIQPGKYTVTVRTSGCPGTLTYKKNVKGGTVGLPPFICRGKK
jgi:hypothetical protein